MQPPGRHLGKKGVEIEKRKKELESMTSGEAISIFWKSVNGTEPAYGRLMLPCSLKKGFFPPCYEKISYIRAQIGAKASDIMFGPAGRPLKCQDGTGTPCAASHTAG